MAIIVSGGLGPTADDITRQAIAAATRRPLAMNELALEALRVFARFGTEMTDNNRQQALIPEGRLLRTGRHSAGLHRRGGRRNHHCLCLRPPRDDALDDGQRPTVSAAKRLAAGIIAARAAYSRNRRKRWTVCWGADVGGESNCRTGGAHGADTYDTSASGDGRRSRS